MKYAIIFFFWSGLALASFCEDRAFSLRADESVATPTAIRLANTIRPFNTINENVEPTPPALPLQSTGRGNLGPAMGVESYSFALRRETELLLNRNISRQEEESINQANHLGGFKDPQKTKWAGIRAKIQILKTAGFSKQEIRNLMESGIVWIRNVSSLDMLMHNLKERKENIYFLSNDGTIHRLRKVLQETNEDFIVEVETLGEHGRLLKKIKRNISKTNPYHVHKLGTIHSDTQALYESAKSNRKKVSREDLNLSSVNHLSQEAELKKKGYGPAWTKGLDKLNEWVAVRQQLQSLKAHPRITHIQYFADQIADHIAFVESALEKRAKQDLPISPLEQQALDHLKKEAKSAVKEERVTYAWWVKFNFDLSQLFSVPRKSIQTDSPATDKGMDPLSKRNPHSHIKPAYPSATEKIISQFPFRMAVPTTLGELGIMTLNRLQSERIYPLGIITQPKAVDNRWMDPSDFYSHDMSHIYDHHIAIRQHSPGHRLKHKKMQELIEGLPTEKRKQAELIYFNSTHEDIQDSLMLNQTRNEIANKMAKQFAILLHVGVFSEKMAGLGPEYPNLKTGYDKIQYIKEHIIEDFMREVYDPAF